MALLVSGSAFPAPHAAARPEQPDPNFTPTSNRKARLIAKAKARKAARDAR